ncbi:hypothetical protein [Bacillus stercoris]|uniref:hypothetical protein n=1 Tax=Bacillus stercoris TaxID=2054641 RepID=UPI003CEC28C5
MEKILKHIMRPNDKIIKYGVLDEKILRELKMITSLYDYIEVVTNYYDDEDDPYRINWTDIEGMGYGWAWMNYDEKDWHKMMSKVVSHETDLLLRNVNDALYFVYENGKVKTYHFVYIGDCRYDTVISFSNNEIGL